MTELQDTQMLKYIIRTVNDLQIKEREEVLQMIYNAVPDSKIHTKGDGTEIKVHDIPHSTILMIHNYINTKMTTKMLELKQYTE
jgi:hypothetical protein